jgi:hypothetical protein
MFNPFVYTYNLPSSRYRDIKADVNYSLPMDFQNAWVVSIVIPFCNTNAFANSVIESIAKGISKLKIGF